MKQWKNGNYRATIINNIWLKKKKLEQKQKQRPHTELGKLPKKKDKTWKCRTFSGG